MPSRRAAEAKTAEKKEKQAARVKAAPEPAKAKGKLSYKQKFALENLPKEMAKIEADIAKLEERMADPQFFARDPDGFSKAAKVLERERETLAAKEEEWLELEMLREELEG